MLVLGLDWADPRRPGGDAGVRTLAVPHNRESPSIDMHGVKRDRDKIHWCILNHLTQSFMGVRTLNLGDYVFLYTGRGNLGAKSADKIYSMSRYPLMYNNGCQICYIQYQIYLCEYKF